MGRQYIPPHQSRGRPTGPKWTAFRRQQWVRAARAGNGTVYCYHCGHVIAGLAVGEVQHLLSPLTHPHLAWDPDNCVWSHAGGRKRCPACLLSCQHVAASNTSPRDPDGRPLPFPPAYLALKTAEARAKLGKPARPVKTARANPSAPAAPPPAPAPSPTAPPYAVDVQPDGRYRCDQVLTERGKVRDARPGSGCTEWHVPGNEGRCW